MTISLFIGEYHFLSNFFDCIIVSNGEVYSSVEHAYQAAKNDSRHFRDAIKKCKTPGAAKRLGKTAQLRPNWDVTKVRLMERLVRDKFFRHPSLVQALKATGNQELIEGNNWNDTFWGQCSGVGENHLGKILMKVRAEL